MVFFLPIKSCYLGIFVLFWIIPIVLQLTLIFVYGTVFSSYSVR